MASSQCSLIGGRVRHSVACAVLLAALAGGLWGCDMGGIPTTTPLVGTSTAVVATATPIPTLVPLTETASIEASPPTEPTTQPTIETLEMPSPTQQLVATPSADMSTVAPGLEPPTSTPEAGVPTPTLTPRPRPTRTPAPDYPAAESESPPTPATQHSTPAAAEFAPSGGWSEVVRAAPGKKRIALTFDAGASGETCPRILSTLRDHGVHITMFFTGKFVEQYPDCVKQAVAEGHELGNHTYSHLDSRKLTDEQLAGELDRTETIIRNLTGATTKPYWRPPFGARNNHVLNVTVAQGYRSIYWTLDSLDSVGQPKTADFIFNRVTNTPGVNLDGAIILQHFGSDASADALPRELDRLREMGLQVVTISELLSP